MIHSFDDTDGNPLSCPNEFLANIVFGMVAEQWAMFAVHPSAEKMSKYGTNPSDFIHKRDHFGDPASIFELGTGVVALEDLAGFGFTVGDFELFLPRHHAQPLRGVGIGQRPRRGDREFM